MLNKFSKLTDVEAGAISYPYNLTDGHARFGYHNSRIIFQNALEKMDLSLLDRQQANAEARFADSFFGLAKQTPNHSQVMYCPSASQSIEIVANYLRLNAMKVALIEPAFDNLADILKRHNVSLVPVGEATLESEEYIATLKQLNVDALFLVLPNNPTGYTLSSRQFIRLVEFCETEGILLILDFCFRFFSSHMHLWDQYALLDYNNISYITIEDTGKTWSTFELKVSCLASSAKVYASLQAIYRDLFICQPPLVLNLLTEFVLRSSQDGLNSVRNIANLNREKLRNILPNWLIPSGTTQSNVEWIKITNGMSDKDMQDQLQANRIHILPGGKFFWSQRLEFCPYFRVALMRDPEVFSSAMVAFRETIERYL